MTRYVMRFEKNRPLEKTKQVAVLEILTTKLHANNVPPSLGYRSLCAGYSTPEDYDLTHGHYILIECGDGKEEAIKRGMVEDLHSDYLAQSLKEAQIDYLFSTSDFEVRCNKLK